MAGRRIEGTRIAREKREALTAEVESIKEQHPNFKPCVAMVQIGDNASGSKYMELVQKAAPGCHVTVIEVRLLQDITMTQVQARIDEFNKDPDVHGIIIMYPVDSTTGITFNTVVEAITPEKDVEGMRYENIGKLSRGEEGVNIPSAAEAMMGLIQSTGTPIADSRVLVLGQRVTTGAPFAQLMITNKAIVTVCPIITESITKSLPSLVGETDILVATMCKSEMVKAEWIKKGAVVIDCGFDYKDGRPVGDVENNAMTMSRVSWITPVPGGVGPVLVATLLIQTVQLAKKQAAI